MKRTIEILLRLVAPPARLVALLLAVVTAGGVWAAVPVPTAVWELDQISEYDSSTDTIPSTSPNYVLNVNGNTVDTSAGKITIGTSKALTIDTSTAAPTEVSVLIKYAAAPKTKLSGATVAAAVYAKSDTTDSYDVGVVSQNASSIKLYAYYNCNNTSKSSGGIGNNPTLSETGGYLLFDYNLSKTHAYCGSSVSALTGGTCGTTFSNRKLTCISIGGVTGLQTAETYYTPWEGFVVEKVAIFVGRTLTGTDIADFRWPSEIKEILPDRDMINLNISNEGGYAITGSGFETIPTLAGEMLDNAWQNTKDGTKSHTGSGARNAYVTGITAYDASTKSATTLGNVRFAWAVEAGDVANYGNVAIDNNPLYHKAWLARANGAGGTPSILVQAIPYKKYDVIVYCFGSDDDAFDPITINGIPYVGDTTLETDTKTRKATSSSETWGGRRAQPSLGQTAIRVNGLENPELSVTTVGGKRSFCAVQIVRDMSEGVWPTSKKVISLNLASSYSSNGTTPAVYGLEPVPDAAWTKDGVSSITSSGTDVSATIMEWNGTSAVTATGVTVNEKAANTYGWSDYTYTPQNQILSGYLDDGSPQVSVTVANVPYDVYDVIVYCATDEANRQFGPVTVNSTPYRWDDDKQCAVIASSGSSTDATRWGASRSRLPAYGLNAIRIPSQTHSTLTIAGADKANSARGCIAAIQIVEAYSGLQVYANGSWSNDTEPTSGDAIIVVDGDTTLSIDGTATLGTVTITGKGTLTLSGSGKFTATTIKVESFATLNVNTERLDATTYVGDGTVVYTAMAPETGKGWTDSANWTGTVEIKDDTTSLGNFHLTTYGNSESKVCMNGAEGYLYTKAYSGSHGIKELVIGDGGFTQNGSYSVENTFTLPCKVTGSGEYKFSATGDGQKTLFFTGDVSEFSGKITIGGKNNRIVIGSSTERTFKDQSLIVAANASITVRKQWGTDGFSGGIFIDENGYLEVASNGFLPSMGGFTVDGILKTLGLDYEHLGNIAKSATKTAAEVLIKDTGVLILNGSSSDDYDFSNVTGTGTIRYAGTSWRSFPDTNPFADTLTVEIEQTDGVAYSGSNNGTKTIGSIFGTKNLRSDLGGSNKTLVIKQAKDGEWSGVFSGGGNNPDRLSTFVVQPGSSAAGTLKLSGAQTQSNDIQIDAGAKVNLTGTWVGAATVSGTFGGTGTLTGSLTFNAGSTFKAFASDENGLSVSSTVSYPESGTVTVDVDALGSPESDVVLISKSGLDETKFALKSGSPAGYALKVEGDALKLKANATVAITVPTVENTTVTVTANDTPVEGDNGVYTVPYGSAVVVTYAAVNGYELSGTATYNIASATENMTITVTDTVANQYVACVYNYSTSQNDQYTSLAAAVAAADGTTHATIVVLTANVTEVEVVISSAVIISGSYTINSAIKIADGGQLQLMSATLNGKLTIEDGGAYKTNGGTLGELVAEDGATIELTTLNDTTAPLSVTTLSVEGTLTVKSSYGSGALGSAYKAISYVTANATIAQNAEFVGVNQWESSVETDGDNTIVSLAFTKIAVVNGLYYENAQDAVDAAVASGQPVTFLSAPGILKLGEDETLVVTGTIAPEQGNVVLDDGLTTPPYEVIHTQNVETLTNTYTVNRMPEAAIVDTNGNAHDYYTVQAAVDDLLGLYLYSNTYDHIDIYSSTNLEVKVDASSMFFNSYSIKIKCIETDVSVSVVSLAAEYDDFVPGEPDADGVITYIRAEMPTTYVWVGTGTTPVLWGNYNKWKIGTVEGATATRAPSTNDDVILNGSAPINIADNVITVSSITIVGATEIRSASGTLTATSSIVLADSSASITAPEGVLSPLPTTSVEGKGVTWSTVDGNTTYSLVDPVAKIGDNGYGSLALAIAAASDNDTITLSANCSESVDLGGKSITFNEGSYTFSGSFTGNGTLALTTLLKSAATERWAAGWTGTVWFKNMNGIQIEPAKYGNVNSVMKFTGVSGWIANGTTCSPAFEFEDDGETKALTMYYTSAPSTTLTFSEFRGTGTFVTAGNDSGYTRTNFRVQKWSDFTGSLDIDRGRVIFGEDTISTDDWRYIYVSTNETVAVASGKTWTATQGFRVYGTLNAVTPDNLTGKLVGSGRVELGSLRSSAFTFDNWTGTVVLPAISSTPNQGHRLDYYGKAGSTIEIDKGFSGWLSAASDDSRNVKAAVRLSNSSSMTITGSNRDTTYGFAKLSGNGNFTFKQTYQPSSITIGILEDYTGTIANTDNDGGTPTVITVNKVKLASAPAAGDKLVATSTPTYVNIASGEGQGVYVGDTKHDVILEKKTDGIYVAAKKSVDSVVIAGADEPTNVTVLDTGLNTAVDASSLSGKVAIPGTVTQISGVDAENLLLKVTYTPSGESATTEYYSGILALDNSGNVSLDPSGTVTIAKETVKVQPETAEDSPMTFTGSSPSFAVKAIPGLWYQVLAADSVDDGALVSPVGGTAVQATTTTVSPAAPVFTGTVKFYKIAVGASQAALQ